MNNSPTEVHVLASLSFSEKSNIEAELSISDEDIVTG